MTAIEIARVAYAAGFRGLALVNAVAVALAESSGEPNAHNTSGEDSRGLWQINVLAHPQYVQSNLFDPAVNAGAAYALSHSGADWSAWSTWTGGAYRRFLQAAGEAATAIGSIGINDPTPPPPAGTRPPSLDPLPGHGGSGINVPPISVPGVDLAGITDPVAKAVAGVGTQLSQTIASAFNAALTPLIAQINNLSSFGRWLGQPNLVLRVALFPIGVGVALIGLVLFAVSFIPREDIPKILPVPV